MLMKNQKFLFGLLVSTILLNLASAIFSLIQKDYLAFIFESLICLVLGSFIVILLRKRHYVKKLKQVKSTRYKEMVKLFEKSILEVRKKNDSV